MDQELAVTRVEQAIKSNKERKAALLGYIQSLEAQLSSVDSLINGAAAHMDVPDDMDSDEELLYTVSVPGAIVAVPPFATEELEDEGSPFYKAAQRHIRYNDLTSSRNWTETENATLKDAVQREAMRYHAFQLQSQGFDAIAVLQGVPLSNYGEAKENLDWTRISRYVPNRLPSMCKVRWLAHEHPGVQRGPWTEAERMDLKRAVSEATRPLAPGAETPAEEEREIDWEVVAGYMGNGRIAADCMKAYRSSFGKAVPTIWTPELDTALLEAVGRCSEKNMTNVAMEMPIVLSRAQCAARYSTLKAPKATGKWTPEEDEQLQKLADEIPETTKNRWGLISGRMASRTGRQCRNHFYEILDQSVERGEWTEADDQTIQEAIRSSAKVDCKKLAAQLNRPVTMLRRRVNTLSKASKKQASQGHIETEPIEQSRGSVVSNPSRMPSVSSTEHLENEHASGGDVLANSQEDATMEGTDGEGSGQVVNNLVMEVVMGNGLHPQTTNP